MESQLHKTYTNPAVPTRRSTLSKRVPVESGYSRGSKSKMHAW